MDFKVSLLQNHSFKFSVCLTAVGFLVYALHKVESEFYYGFFNMWGNAGPNWIREYDRWEDECDAEWTVVSRSKANHHVSHSGFLGPRLPVHFDRKSFADVIKLSPDPKLVPIHSVCSWIYHDLALSALQTSSSKIGKSSEVNRPDRSPRIDSARFHFSNPNACNLRREITCFKYLAVGHFARSCSSDVRCRLCFGYGHIHRFCLACNLRGKRYRQVSKLMQS